MISTHYSWISNIRRLIFKTENSENVHATSIKLEINIDGFNPQEFSYSFVKKSW